MGGEGNATRITEEGRNWGKEGKKGPRGQIETSQRQNEEEFVRTKGNREEKSHRNPQERKESRLRMSLR